MPLAVLKHLLTVTLIIAISTYLAFGIYLYFNQHKALYHPTGQDFYDCPAFADTQALNHQGSRFFYKNLGDKLAVLYHGNASSACNGTYWKKIFENHNISYIIVEYAGYAGDPKTPNLNDILQDVKNINNYIKNFNYDQLIYIGESLGSGPAAYHSTLTPPDKLLLIPAYTSIAEVVQYHYPLYPIKLMIKDNYNPQTWLQNYQNQLLIIHGIDDQLLPIFLAKKLYNSVSTSNKQFTVITQTDHNNIYTSSQTIQAIQNFL
jgi:hypothetical protein